MEPNLSKLVSFISMGSIVGIISESCQYFGLVPGTFDAIDCICMVCAVMIALVVLQRFYKKVNTEQLIPRFPSNVGLDPAALIKPGVAHR